MTDEVPADFEQRYGLIHPDHSGVDLTRLRRHHQRTARRLRDELKRRRELEAEVEHLKRTIVEISVTWYGGSSAFFGQLGHGVDVGEDNPDRG